MVTIKQYLRADLLPGVALVLIAFGVSLFFEGYRDIHYAPAALALLVFACIGIIPAFWRGLTVPAAPAAILIFVFWLYVTLSLSWSSVPFASLVTYLIFFAGPLMFFTLLLAPARETWLAATGWPLFIALAIIAAWAVIQSLFLSDIYGVRAHHPLPNPNNLAGLLNLGLIPALGIYLGLPPPSSTSPLEGGGMRRVWRSLERLTRSWVGGGGDIRVLAALALTLLFFAGLVATGSRGGLLSALIAACILVFILRASPDLWKRVVTISIPALILFILAGMVTDIGFANRLGDLAAISSDGPAMARLAIWESGWQMFKDHFWIGAGLGTFYLYYPGYRQPGADDSSGGWVHMDPLQYGIEMGIIAPLLFYGIALAVILRTIKALKAAPASSSERTFIAAPFCALLALILHTHASFHLYIMPILIVSGCWLALWYHMTAKTLGESYRPVAISPWQKPFMAAVTLAIAGLIATMAVSSALGQHHLLRAHNLINQGLTEQFAEAIEEAEKWAPRSFVDPEVQLAALYIDLLGENAAALFTPAEQQSLFIQTKELLDIAAQMNPPWAEVDYKRGQLYARIKPDFAPDARAMAVSALERAIAKNPMHFRAREELARLYMQRGFVEKAYRVLEDGLAYRHSPAVAERLQTNMKNIAGLLALKKTYDEEKQVNPGSPPETGDTP